MQQKDFCLLLKDLQVYYICVLYTTHLFFLLALRKDMAHLRWLARLSWICRNRTIVANLLKAPDVDEIARILRMSVEELPGNLRQRA